MVEKEGAHSQSLSGRSHSERNSAGTVCTPRGHSHLQNFQLCAHGAVIINNRGGQSAWPLRLGTSSSEGYSQLEWSMVTAASVSSIAHRVARPFSENFPICACAAVIGPAADTALAKLFWPPLSPVFGNFKVSFFAADNLRSKKNMDPHFPHSEKMSGSKRSFEATTSVGNRVTTGCFRVARDPGTIFGHKLIAPVVPPGASLA